MPKKIIRSLCLFTEKLASDANDKLTELQKKLEAEGFLIQTKRICTNGKDFAKLELFYPEKDILLSVGNCDLKYVINNNYDFYKASRTSCHVDISTGVNMAHVEMLFRLIEEAPEKMFQFAFVVNNTTSSPYFPSASFEKNGFALGLQPTDLAEGCSSLEEWFANMQNIWEELCDVLKDESDFLGIDSSIAPLFEGNSSLVQFIKEVYGSFDTAVLSDAFIKITSFIKNNNPKPVGLCGLMLPCLEDFLLADEYKQGKFSLERNLFLSLHSGLGIDTYPIGTDESPEKVLNILQLLVGLSNKYNKPLSARFISDGKAKIGEETSFDNQFLKDVIIKAL
ncbi:DUF711 family protein [Chondrinema litorale]|uniref:DUF711 family protein n=1 Tax=Chondrinema litorale TaxID=2994555 RepID=UPI0025430002|nr:DUF711 family protein [Chondrinema litorale]UZR99361.1 DUF711 family protein [Chondrinema litorale]